MPDLLAFLPCALIPCLDAGRTIGAVVRGTLEQVPAVLVVDDGSRDATGSEARAAGAEVVVHAVNQGKGAALLTGLAAARERGFSHAVTLDGDAQHDPAEIPRLLEAARAAPQSLIVGARSFDIPNVPQGSRFGRWFCNLWVWVETGRRLEDTQSGFRVYPVDFTLDLGLPPSRFEWEVEVLVRASWAGAPLAEVPVAVRYPADRVSHYRGFVDSLGISLLHCRLVARRILRPLWPTRRLLPAP